jgi:hypothetical protein
MARKQKRELTPEQQMEWAWSELVYSFDVPNINKPVAKLMALGVSWEEIQDRLVDWVSRKWVYEVINEVNVPVTEVA